MAGDRRFLLLGGIIFFLIGVASLLVGETLNTRYSRQTFADRSREPVRFWFLVAFQLLAALILFVLYFTRISN